MLTCDDVAAIWVLHWMRDLKGALPADLINAERFPKVFGWIDRFNEAVNAAKKRNAKPTAVTGEEARERILGARYVDADIGVDEKDPLGFKKGEMVEVWPTDSGSSGRDRGKLVGLDGEEVVITLGQGEEEIRLHFPRTGFRIVRVGGEPKL